MFRSEKFMTEVRNVLVLYLFLIYGFIPWNKRFISFQKKKEILLYKVDTPNVFLDIIILVQKLKILILYAVKTNIIIVKMYMRLLCLFLNVIVLVLR